MAEIRELPDRDRRSQVDAEKTELRQPSARLFRPLRTAPDKVLCGFEAGQLILPCAIRHSADRVRAEPRGQRTQQQSGDADQALGRFDNIGDAAFSLRKSGRSFAVSDASGRQREN